jgi:hypothetical protein
MRSPHRLLQRLFFIHDKCRLFERIVRKWRVLLFVELYYFCSGPARVPSR